MMSVFLASAIVVSALNSPSGTLIIDLKAPLVLEGGYKPAKFDKWDLELFDFGGEKVGFETERHPALPGYVLESLDKREGVASLGYRMKITYCNSKSECKQVIFKKVADIKAEPTK